MLKLLVFLLLTFFVRCNDDDDDGFGWGFDDDDDDFAKEIDWDKVPVQNAIILGSGPAGSTAALYLARAGFSPLVLHGSVPGGQLVYTTEIENFPGFNGTGPELVSFIQKQAENAGAVYKLDRIVEVNLSVYPFTLKSDFNKGYKCKSLIIATGATAKYLNIESEQRLKNRGVSACAICDGALYKGQNVAVVGGGDVAAEEALYLERICKSVKMIVRRESLTASLPMQKKVLASSIEVIYDSNVNEVLGENFVTGVEIKNSKTGKTQTLDVNALFVAIGSTPSTEPFKGWLDMDKDGYFITNGSPETKIPGVFVAGDCADRIYRQAVTSAGTGCQAALLAERYLSSKSD